MRYVGYGKDGLGSTEKWKAVRTSSWEWEVCWTRLLHRLFKHKGKLLRFASAFIAIWVALGEIC